MPLTPKRPSPDCQHQRGAALAGVALAILAFTGCGNDDSDGTERPSDVKTSATATAVDYSDPLSVIDLYGKAYAAGDCEAASQLHVPDSYDIDCSDSYDYNPFIAAKNMGLTFKGAEQAMDESASEERVPFILTFTDVSGYMLKSESIEVQRQDGKWLVTSPMYDMPTQEDLD